MNMTIGQAKSILQQAGYNISNVEIGDLIRFKNPGIAIEKGFGEPAYGWYSIENMDSYGGLTILTDLVHPDEDDFSGGTIQCGIEDIITEPEDKIQRQRAWDVLENLAQGRFEIVAVS
jgi:hypothetical protein